MKSKSSSSSSLYNVLGVSPHATEEEIKKVFRQLALTHHPDRGGDAEKFKEINEAYDILSDPQKRRRYDQTGSTDETMMGEMPTDINDLMENLFGANVGGGFFGPFHRTASSSRHPSSSRKVPPKQYDLHVSLEDIYTGTTLSSTILKKVYVGNHQSNTKCRDCHGKGQVVQQISMGFMITQNITTCTSCQGTGHIYSDTDFKQIMSKIDIPIPKGCVEGSKICIRQKGDEMPDAETGDVLFTIQYKPHPFYYTIESEIGDLFCAIDISFYEMLYGFSRNITFLDGQVYHLVQPAMKPMNSVIHKPLVRILKQHGLFFKHHQGDLHILFNVHIPLLKDITINKTLHDILKEPSYYPSIQSSTTMEDDVPSHVHRKTILLTSLEEESNATDG